MSRLKVLAAAAALVLLAGCAPSDQNDAAPTNTPTSASDAAPTQLPVPVADPKTQLPLRAGEKRMTLAMPTDYTPSAPTGVGTDDYRCFLLDPHLTKDVYLTGTNVLPGNPDVVHHVILFRVDPAQVAEAKAKDASEDGEGWTCFGGTGLRGDFSNVDDANWLGAWAPGGKESETRPGYGVHLARGSRIIMQVHYNLLVGDSPDRSAAQVRWRPGTAHLDPIHTFLMPAPVELPCRAGHDQSPLCDRDAAVADVKARFGQGPGSTADILYFLCGGTPHPSEVTSCTRRVQQPMTILGVAGHMHLLGRWIRIETNPGTPEAKTILDIPIWDFDNQGAKPITPVHLDTWDTVKVTCKHVQWLRDKLPSFQGQDERYVVWGEGTTDEMCLGMLQVAFDGERS
ncbi:hypothetical protein FB382_001038 [Nocardioides ginsengisegetis]|uniref:Copper type II ascorbate-dependent monooxygenase, C-terminal domain n=1 Tax=Nocardioides ginsengisegetis TaxID=661491 RepID=A0A7W3IXZ6_9ACTN|nr:hypothetical protein [Nocardioides ginsengisegetis]MBA8802747.1 hypothetical protein [Nocardioides ginsengisegetis]